MFPHHPRQEWIPGISPGCTFFCHSSVHSLYSKEKKNLRKDPILPDPKIPQGTPTSTCHTGLMKISFYTGILLTQLKAHANQGISPVSLGDFNFSTSISHHCWALIYGLGLTWVCHERVLLGWVWCKGIRVSLTRGKTWSRLTWWDTINKTRRLVAWLRPSQKAP